MSHVNRINRSQDILWVSHGPMDLKEIESFFRNDLFKEDIVLNVIDSIYYSDNKRKRENRDKRV